MAVVTPDDETDDDAKPASGRIVIPNEIQEAIGKGLAIHNKLGLQGISGPAWRAMIPKLGFINTLVPNLNPITQAMGKNLASSILGDIGKSNLLGVTSGMDSLFSRILPTFDFLKGLDLDLTRGPWPTNLEHMNWDPEILYRLTVDEGLPIAWVPRAETMKQIFEAETPAKRRAIYGRRWRGIIEDCQELADNMDSAWLAPYMRFLHEVIGTMRDGHYMAAQSLAASTLDTVAFYLAHSTWKSAKNPEKLDDPGTLPIRTYFVWSQLAGIYKRYFRDKDDPIPATFNRHGASHGVSSRQYSRLNATLGMAHLTSLMWIIDSETRHLNRRCRS